MQITDLTKGTQELVSKGNVGDIFVVRQSFDLYLKKFHKPELLQKGLPTLEIAKQRANNYLLKHPDAVVVIISMTVQEQVISEWTANETPILE